MQEFESLYQAYLKHRTISTDTRKISEGCIFFALKGPNFNGNSFAKQALEAGAAYVVVDEDINLPKGKFFKVDDVLKVLQALAVHHRNTLSIPVIGLTGSNGKTTTKELIHAVLARKYKVWATQGNLNNHIGVPVSILGILPEHEMAIIEMGANAQKEIEMLSNFCYPTHALITNIGKAHLGGFGGYEGVIIAKTELYKHAEKHGSTLFVHKADEVLKKHLPQNVPLHYYGEGSEVTASNLQSEGTLSFDLHVGNETSHVQTQLYGAFNSVNMLCAAAIGNYFKVSIKDIAKALSGYVPSNNRSQVSKTEHNTLILDAYNANPSSMENAIDAFYLDKSDAKALILGDMFELGEESELEHQKIITKVQQLGFTEVYWVGEMFSQISPSIGKSFKTTADCFAYLKDNPIRKKKILIKGSRGIALEKLVELL